MSDLILHHYDASPFAQKVHRMLGLKGAVWRSVTVPMILPKPDLVALTGGYRGVPVLQIGADVYVDTQLIARVLEARMPEPNLFPNGNWGMPQALVKWSDAFFQAGLTVAVAHLGDQWDDDFAADRKALFVDMDFAAAKQNLAHAKSQLRAHASFINDQLSDGRVFLQGDSPGLADFQAFSVPWFLRSVLPELMHELFEDFNYMKFWEDRISMLGEGHRSEIEASEALAEARDAEPLPGHGVEPAEAQELEVGMEVEVAPDDYRRGGVRGALVTASSNEVAIARNGDEVGDVVVHFPRLGYRVMPV